MGAGVAMSPDASSGAETSRLGVCVIGRNEGERLLRCLDGVRDGGHHVVYVDSGSSDGSRERAAELGVEVVQLDPSRPFTAARARNAGFARLLERRPGLAFVQFVDADSELAPGWLEAGAAHLEAHAEVAAVCGALRERHPDASPYNRLAALEWRLPPGETDACGGIAMYRSGPFGALGGFREDMIAGEEPELCYRIREAGHRIVRLEHAMAVHDAAIFRFAQWWRRSVRAGHAFAEAAALHGHGADRFQAHELASILFWGAGLPGGIALGLWPTSGLSLLGLAGYGLLWSRIFRSRRQSGEGRDDSALYASAATLGKFAELLGIARFAWNRLVLRRASLLIEYKS
jgi:GT2 family glycosyltransferase